MKIYPINLAVCAVCLGIAACGGNILEMPTQTLPVAVFTATPAPVPLYKTVTLDSIPFAESGQAPVFELKAQTPVLKGSDDPRVEKFNNEAAAIVQKEIDSFRTGLAELPKTPISAGSYFDLHYALVSPPGKLLSLQFKVDAYSDGAAHPFSYTVTFTYDLEAGNEIILEQLFVPGADYLQVISDTCQAELSKRDIGFDIFTNGANPTPDNYRNWNISSNGLVITFDEYQVAPYVAGPQTLVIPYDALKDIIDPQGPLADFIMDSIG